MESLLYKHLYLKAHKDKTGRRLYICEKSPTAKDLLGIVDRYKYYLNANPIKGKVYLLARNEINTIAMLIALLDQGYSPILVDYNNYHIEKKGNTVDYPHLEHNIVGYFDEDELDRNRLYKDISKMEERIVVNEPKKGSVGILTSGSVSTPKLVYLNEKDIIKNVKASKFVDYDRKIYNPINISSISGLFTNVFFPIIGKNTTAGLNSDYHMNMMLYYTDVYLKRDIYKIFRDMTRIEVGEIKRFFIFGETNNKDTIDFLHNLDVLDFQVINVYGSTELAGLAYECEEKDMQEIFIYNYDIDNDSITYTYDKIHFYRKEKKKKRELNQDEINSIINKEYIRFLPCGLKDHRIKINNYNLGEATINGYNTGDVFLIVDNRLYALGRRQDLVLNTSLSYLDNLFATKINKKCTIIPHNNELYLAVRYPLEYNIVRIGNDYTTYFRRFIDEAKKIREIVNGTSTRIKDILFLTDRDFPISNSLHKSRRNEFEEQLKYYQTITYRLENFDSVLNEFIKKVFMEKLNYIPNYELDVDKNIVIPFNEINEKQLVDIMNELNVVAIERHEDEGKYYIFYDDSYFFDINRNYLYSEAKIDEYKVFAKVDLFIPKLLADNCQKYLKDLLSDSFKFPSCYYVNVKIVIKVGVTENNEVILIPYYQSPLITDFLLDIYKNDVEKYIKEKYPNIKFKDCTIDGISIGYNTHESYRYFMEKPITIKPNGEIISNYLGKIIATAYLNQDVFEEATLIQVLDVLNSDPTK